MSVSVLLLPIERCLVPANTLLDRYSTPRAYADCYQTEVPGQVSFPQFIFAFYTTPLFKLERLILSLTVSRPSTDLQAKQLADGSRHQFAAWQLESRGANELLMCDFRGRTRSWLMVVPFDAGTRTRLYFGSAVIAIRNTKTGQINRLSGLAAPSVTSNSTRCLNPSRREAFAKPCLIS